MDLDNAQYINALPISCDLGHTLICQVTWFSMYTQKCICMVTHKDNQVKFHAKGFVTYSRKMASYARFNINAHTPHTNTHDKHLITIETSIHSSKNGLFYH